MADRSGSFFKGLLLGGALGAVAGMLFAPKTGRELRQEISDETDKLVDKLRADLENAKETFEEGKQKIMEKLNREAMEEPPAVQEDVDAAPEPPVETPRKRSTRK
jgi:gas vesicle protein